MREHTQEEIKLAKDKEECQYLRRDLFKEIIDTNNKETIQSAINYIYSKSNCMFSPCQFLFQAIYKIDHNIDKMEISNKKFDFSLFDESISKSNELHLKMKAITGRKAPN